MTTFGMGAHHREQLRPQAAAVGRPAAVHCLVSHRRDLNMAASLRRREVDLSSVEEKINCSWIKTEFCGKFDIEQIRNKLAALRFSLGHVLM